MKVMKTWIGSNPSNTEAKNNVVTTLEKPPNKLLLQKPLYNVIKTFLKVRSSQTNL